MFVHHLNDHLDPFWSMPTIFRHTQMLCQRNDRETPGEIQPLQWPHSAAAASAA